MAGRDGDSLILSSQRSERVERVFRWWVRRMFRRAFVGVGVARGTAQALRDVDDHDGPLIVAMNHSSWWDPLLGMILSESLAPSRTVIAPMDYAEIQRMRIFLKLGLFGVDPDNPDSLEPMREHVRSFFASTPRGALWITPQGEFCDPRLPVVVRPGAAAVAAGLEGVRVVCCAAEYVFWNEQKPEIVVRCQACPAPEQSTTPRWTKALRETMQANGDALGALASSREPDAFESLMATQRGRINPLYDGWLKLRGRFGTLGEDRKERTS